MACGRAGGVGVASGALDGSQDVCVSHLHLALGSRLYYSAEMKIRFGAAFVLSLLFPTVSDPAGARHLFRWRPRL